MRPSITSTGFFFQAEDGIRDGHVTGVQTCALPILMPVIDALRAAGIAISDDPRRIDIVLASYDRTFTYAKLQIAFDALWRADRGARLMSTNPDRYCPFPAGRGEPDTAGIVAAIEATTGVRCERTFGKPEAPIAQMALEGVGMEPAESAMDWYRLCTDIAV